MDFNNLMKDPYKNIASWYDTIFDPFNNGLRQIGLKMFLVTAGMNVLDIGCGTGVHLKIYQEKRVQPFWKTSRKQCLIWQRKNLVQNLTYVMQQTPRSLMTFLILFQHDRIT